MNRKNTKKSGKKDLKAPALKVVVLKVLVLKDRKVLRALKVLTVAAVTVVDTAAALATANKRSTKRYL